MLLNERLRHHEKLNKKYINESLISDTYKSSKVVWAYLRTLSKYIYAIVLNTKTKIEAGQSKGNPQVNPLSYYYQGKSISFSLEFNDSLWTLRGPSRHTCCSHFYNPITKKMCNYYMTANKAIQYRFSVKMYFFRA